MDAWKHHEGLTKSATFQNAVKKNSFCNFKRPFIKGQMGTKVFEVRFSALWFCLLAGWREEEMRS